MFNSNNGYSLSDIAAASGNSNSGLWGGNDGWWIILLFLFCFNNGWGGNGLGSQAGTAATASGITDGYILTSDFASLERQMENGFDRLASQGVQVANGISSLGYDQLNQMNGINTNINTAANGITGAINSTNNNLTSQLIALGTQLSSCCCDAKYQAATNAATANYNLAEQSCQTRQTVNDAAQAITLNQDANTRSILSAIQDMQTQALQDKIAELTAVNSDLRFQASQAAQNAYLVDALGTKVAQAAYVVPNPYTGSYGYSTGCSCSM